MKHNCNIFIRIALFIFELLHCCRALIDFCLNNDKIRSNMNLNHFLFKKIRIVRKKTHLELIKLKVVQKNSFSVGIQRTSKPRMLLRASKYVLDH